MRSRWLRAPSSRPRRNGRCARRGCPGSTSCRCRRRTRSAPAAASRPHAQDPKRMSLLQRLATVGFGRKDEAHPDTGSAAAPARGSSPADVAGPCGIRQASGPPRRAIARRKGTSTRRENGSGATQRGRRPAGDSGFPAPPSQLIVRMTVTALSPGPHAAGAFSLKNVNEFNTFTKCSVCYRT